jgi:hypothetical protein
MATNPRYSKLEACQKAGFEVKNNVVWAYGEQFPLVHPLSIHLKVYRTHASHETRYQAMKAAFEILWPDQAQSYNYWMERMFREHTNHDTEIFSVASGGGCGKSQTAAYIAILFWLALPNKRAVIVTSTTLASLNSRIYGYILRALREIAVPVPFSLKNTPPPSIQCVPPDGLNGIYGVAAKTGSDEKTIQEIIGRHPINALMLILDEAPDMPIAIMNAIPNLKKALEDRFQAIAIGNANSTTDLHGALSTPKVGWDNIDPKKDFRWETTQPNGVALYLNPYDSPAIHETDPKKKAILSKFLITEEKLIEAERLEGIDSEAFWRFTMGFWRSRSTDKTIVSESFLKDYDPTHMAEFSGKHPVKMVAGLDPAFSTGGDKCILRLAVLGHHTNGSMILDFRGESLVFLIRILANTGKSAEIQIADAVIEICGRYNVPLNTLCVDASGQGRGLADVIQLRSGNGFTPTKIYSTNVGTRNVKSFDTVISSAHDMWFTGRNFISHRQIFGLDALAYGQLHTRLIVDKGGKKLLEAKSDYKKRMGTISSVYGRSPDEADAAMLALQSAVLHYGFYPGQRLEILKSLSEESRRYEMALQEYNSMNSPARSVGMPKATYSKGIESIINKRMF